MNAERPLLPPENTDAGAMARLMLLKTLAPQDPGYDRGESLSAMRLMRQAIENRLASPAEYSARGAVSEADIVRLGNQFAGFRDCPTLPNALAAKLHSLTLIAKNPKDRRQQSVLDFFADAVTAASEPIAPTTARYVNVTEWKTKGAPRPGPRFCNLTSLQGNTFYSTDPVPPLPPRHRRSHEPRAR